MIGGDDLLKLAEQIDGGELSPLERSTVATMLRQVAACMEAFRAEVVELRAELDTLKSARARERRPDRFST